jgi:hypothetical protein
MLDFQEGLIKELGEKRVNELLLKRKELWKLNRAWYEQEIHSYKLKLKELGVN